MRNSGNACPRSDAPAIVVLLALALSALPCELSGQGAGRRNSDDGLTYPPALPGGRLHVTDRSAKLLEPPGPLREGVEIARTPPTVEFMYYPGQDYRGRPWSVWGDGSAVGDKFYSAIGDHRSPRGSARVYEYDSTTRELRMLVDVSGFLASSGAVPPGMDYLPAKIHSRIDMGGDGWLYYSTHRGSARTTNDRHGFRGDWVLRTHPPTGKTEIVATHPIPKHSLPAGILDPERLIYYGSTASGTDARDQEVMFFAYDVRRGRLRKTSGGGFARAAILSRSTGRLYWNGRTYDPATNEITASDAPDVRSATAETADGFVYGTSGRSADIWAFNVRTDELTWLGSGAVARQEYTTAMDVDPTGRYLYYVPGAHGGAPADGTPVVQFDVQTRTRKVIAFLHPFYFETYGYTPVGTFSLALSPEGDRLYVVWNGMRRGSEKWESTALTVIHIPESERQP